jgi:ElaB/YqjD/DUF883 family membrane-anchored ribosome-binding protein
METITMNTAESILSSAEPVTAAGKNGASAEKLLSELRTVVADVDRYLRATAGQASEASAAARSRLEATLSSIKEELAKTQRGLVGRARSAAQATDGYVRENPWQSIGIVAGAGLLVGLLVGRR